MRAAKAAKDLQEVINSLCTCLEESITAAALADHNDNGGQYIRAHLIPLLRNICKEVCDTLPAHPSAHIAVWLLERCRASDELQKEGKTWLTTPSPFVNPWRDDAPMSPTGKKPKNGRPERTEKRAMTAEVSFTAAAAMKASSSLSPADLEAEEACAFSSERGDEGEENMPMIKVSSMLSCTDATDFLSVGSQKSEPMTRSASKIWKCAKGDEDGGTSDAGDGPEDPDEELHIGLDIFKPRKAKEACMRGSVCDAVIAGKKRRYTQIITTVEIDLPDEEECLELLRPVKAFEGIGDEDLKLVVAKTKCRAFQPDENIVPYNSISDELHIVVTGTASVSVPHKIGDLHRGDMFGNHLLMPTNTPCMQQIQAFSAPVTTLSISSSDFETLGLKAHYMAKCTKDRMARNFVAPDEVRADHSSKGRASIKSSPYEVVQGYEQTKSDRDMIQRAVKSNKVLGEVLSLSEQQAEMMSDYMRLVFFATGDMVILKGDRGDALYIVQQGYLDCTVDDNLEGEFRIREGDAFGELGLLYDAPRTATIRACCDCRLWVLHRYEFQIVMSMNYCARAAEYAGMLSKIPYMNSLIDPDRMDIVAGVVEEISLMETEELCIEGEDKGFLFLIYYGQCEATQDGEFKRFLNKGDWVGEEQLKDTIAATETVKVCSESAIVVAIDRPTLRMAFDTIKDIEHRGGATSSTARRVSDHLDGAGPADQSAYNDHLTKKKVTNGLLQKRLVKAVGRHKHDNSEWDLSGVEFIGGLGEGSFGKVYLVKNPLTDVLAAVKVMSKEHIIRDSLGPMVQAERKIMMLFDSKFIVRLYASFQDSTSILLLLEAALGGELFDLYSDHSLYGDLNVVRFHIACVTMGLEHMHSLRVIYRDLKLENCLIDTKGYVKLADMGIAKVAIGKSYTVCGTADYFAPETLKQHGHNRAVDWWAMGVLLFIMCSGRSPFDAPEVSQIYKNIIKGFSKVKFPGKFPSDLIDVIKSLCRSKPEERVTMQKGGVENLKEMPFFSKVNWDELAEQTMDPPYKPNVDFDAIRRKKLSPLDLTNVMPWDGSIDMMEQASASPSAPEIPARGG